MFHPCLPDRRVPRAVQHYQRLQRRAGTDAVRAVHQSAQEKVRGTFQRAVGEDGVGEGERLGSLPGTSRIITTWCLSLLT